MLRLILLWLAWCAAHSLLITPGVCRWFERKGRAWQARHRLGYVCFSGVSLLPLLWLTPTVPHHPLALPAWIFPVRVVLGLYTLIMFVGGLRVYDLQSFLGIRQWRDYRMGRSGAPPRFEQTGILGHVRHPWYSGGIALLWALPQLTDASLIIRTLLTVYLIVGTLLEERKLRQSLGEPYRAYCREVPMLIPWKLFRR
ncbi:methyltransferase family protein [Desulfobulbus elongatus]|uniref:methyltransferase family protein n=1 Tax=Desulfobulbus elongatus TaxID=53332 RepID=UPI0006854033|nr:NnrU family protein [Desulfobulbus elongatus]